MPERAEVYLQAEFLGENCIARVLKEISFLGTGRYFDKKPKGFEMLPASVKVDSVQSRGKLIYWIFQEGYAMLSTLGMTGQWSDKPTEHACAKFVFENSRNIESVIYMNDIRHFGTLSVIPIGNLKAKLDTLGWDPLLDFIPNCNLFRSEAGRGYLPPGNHILGDLLLDQRFFAGVGNYIRAEALYRAKLSPWTMTEKLSEAQWLSLYEAIVNVVVESLALQGASFKTYKNSNGEKGGFAEFFKVYGRKADPLGNPVRRETMPGGRTIFWSPDIQGW